MWFRVIGILIVVVAALLVLNYLRAPHTGGPDAHGWYEARPVYGMMGSGFAMQVVSRQAATAADGTPIVVLQVGFRNQGRVRFTARPADFQLLQPAGGIAHPDFSVAACPPWQQLAVPPSTLSRPVPVCFRGAPPGPALTLLWTPDVAPGPLGTENRVELPAQAVGATRAVRPSSSIAA
jgi:hypothetical protein